MTARRHLFHVFATFSVGGPQVRFAKVANALGDRYRHTILAMDGEYEAAARLEHGVEAAFMRDFIPPKGRAPNNVLSFRRILAEMRPSLVVTHNWGSMEWALANTPCLAPHVHVEDGFGADEAAHRLARRTLLRRIGLQGKAVIAASRTIESIAIKEWRLQRKNVRFIANGVESHQFDRLPDPELVSRVRAEGAVLIGTVAALRPEKNLALLVEAFADIRARRPARLVIVGEGPEQKAITARAEALGVDRDVVLLGRLDEPARILRAFDLFMMSSSTEQAPLSLLEAMAAGRAVVATDVGDIAEMVSFDNKPFVTSVGRAPLVKAATELLEDEVLRLKTGAANRAKVIADFSAASMIESWCAVWDGAGVNSRERTAP